MTCSSRTEHDGLGEKNVPADALYGIHSQRAVENFPISGRSVASSLIAAYGSVKLACAQVNKNLGYLDEERYSVLAQACAELQAGQLDEHIVVDALQGGAGTSTNMNVNEVLANRSLQLAQRPLADYEWMHPITHVNMHQSTNDTYPTALRVAVLTQLDDLERAVTKVLEDFQRLERSCADVVKIGRTQMQDAVLTTLGRSMGAYAELISRDRWRLSICRERLRVVNLGGTAIGTGLGAPRQYIFQVVDTLRQLTGHRLARAENLVEATQNHDALMETSGLLKTYAVSLHKIMQDIRLMSSGPDAGLGEITLPVRQAGSSAMPGKINPVICEAVIQVCMKVQAGDALITQALISGNLELNAFLPVVADTLLENVSLLTKASEQLSCACLADLEPNLEQCKRHLQTNTAQVTALAAAIGYEQAQAYAQQAQTEQCSLRDVVIAAQVLDEAGFDDLLTPETVTRLGSRL